VRRFVMKQQTLKRVFGVVLSVVLGLTMSFSFNVGTASAATKAKTVTLKTTAKVVDIGGTVKVTVSKVSPAKASKKVTWKATKGAKYASLSKKATSVTVKGKKAGKITIKATSKSNKKATKTITITVKNLKAKSIKLSKTKLTLDVDGKSTLKATVTAPQKYGYKKQTTKWKSSDTAVVKVSSKGAVTAVGPGEAKITASNDGKSATCSVTVNCDKPFGTVLKKYGITGYYEDGIDTINKVALDETLSVYVWDPATKLFDKGTTADINSSYTCLTDTNANEKADTVFAVRFADGSQRWDATAPWLAGVGLTTPANELSDEDGLAIYGKPYRLPFGERSLSEFGMAGGGYNGVQDFANYEKGGYWENNDADFYNLKSTDTLTILTNYKTTSQPSGSLCVMSSAATVLEWYGQRGDLSDRDLALLRGNDVTESGGTSLTQTIQLFTILGDLGLTCEWDWKSFNDFGRAQMDSGWVQAELAKGHPIIVISNAFGAHGQVIIGYDNMGTEDTLDDVCIMMDPYDTTDQNNDGYILQPFERLQYGLLTWPDEGTTGVKYISVWPKDPALWDSTYKPVKGDGLANDPENKGNFSNDMKIDYGRTAQDIQAFYPDTEDLGTNGLAGAATGGYERSGDYDNSPYFTMRDYYNLKDGESKSGTLKILENFKTVQQSTEWTCGTASALMNIEWFGKNEVRTGDDPGAGSKETDVSLASHRQIDAETKVGKPGATSCAGMKEVFDYMSTQYGQKWTIFTNSDLDDPEGEESYIGDYCLQAGDAYPDWYGLIPYLIDHGIPMMIGSDEWGGHWQVIIGYDGMGTEGTQDDVLIMADPYDTTDHNQDGYFIKSFERLVYGWGSAFEKGFGGTTHNDFIVAFPTEGYQDVITELGLGN